MSWTNELYNVYVNNCGNTDLSVPLLPIAHSTVNVQIEVTLSEEGDFITARKVDKDEAVTVIPVTVDSASRGAGIFPHPLADKLVYIAGDYCNYVSGKKNNSDYFSAYLTGLESWRNSECCHPAVNAIYTYLQKACIISDLVRCNVLELSEDEQRLDESIKNNGIAQEDSSVRFRIAYKDLSRESKTWADASLFDNYIKFNAAHTGCKQLCYATGEETECTYKHPSKIRNAGDKGKLISANDESGFAYRGRFANKEEALSVGYDFSQKMHNALKWLIERQGLPTIGSSLKYLVWESSLQSVPNIIDGFIDGFFDVSAFLKNSLNECLLCKSADTLRGLEGACSMRYFSVFDNLILRNKDSFFFKTRSRRPPLDNVNAMLSFCYSILANECASALSAVGLDPYVGFMHTDRPGRKSLALDLRMVSRHAREWIEMPPMPVLYNKSCTSLPPRAGVD